MQQLLQVMMQSLSGGGAGAAGLEGGPHTLPQWYDPHATPAASLTELSEATISDQSEEPISHEATYLLAAFGYGSVQNLAVSNAQDIEAVKYPEMYIYVD